MHTNRIANRFAGYLIVACASGMPWPAHAASPSSGDSSDATEKHKPSKAKAKARGKGGGDSSTQRHGLASYYSKHLAGHKTSSGEPYDPKAMTAAHRILPMGTRLKVVNPKNDKSVVVTVNDRGPVPKNRMIDLSNAAAKELGMTKSGVTKVDTEVVGKKNLQTHGDARETPTSASSSASSSAPARK